MNSTATGDARALGPAQRVLEQLAEQRAVREVRQGVVVRLVRELVLELRALDRDRREGDDGLEHLVLGSVGPRGSGGSTRPCRARGRRTGRDRSTTSTRRQVVLARRGRGTRRTRGRRGCLSRATVSPVAAAVPQMPEPSAIGIPSMACTNDEGNDGAAPCTREAPVSSTRRTLHRTLESWDSTIRQISASVSLRGVPVAIISRIDAWSRDSRLRSAQRGLGLDAVGDDAPHRDDPAGARRRACAPRARAPRDGRRR